MAIQKNLWMNAGRVVATPGAKEALDRNGMTGLELLRRHLSADWGTLSEDDWAMNVAALASGDRVLSSYVLKDKTKLWIISDGEDDSGRRPATTLLLPEEY